MKSVLSPSLLHDTTTSQLSNNKLELSKYRLSKSDKKPTNTSTQNQSVQRGSQTSAKRPTKFASPERKIPETRTNEIKLGAQKLSFSTFFNNTTEAPKAQTAISQRTLSLSEQEKNEVLNFKKGRESTFAKNTTLKNQFKDLRKNKSKAPSSQIDFSNINKFSEDKAADLAIQYKFRSDTSLNDDNILNSKVNCTVVSSYMTTFADDDGSSLTREQKEYEELGTMRDLCEEIKENRQDSEFTLKKESSDKKEMNMILNENNELKKKISELEQKSAKWEAFTKILLNCHDVVKNEWKEYKNQNEIDKKTIASLKEQVQNLKITKKALKNEVRASTKSTSDVKNSNLEIKFKKLESENQKLMEDLTFLKEENKILHQSQENIEKYKNATEHYRQIAEDKFKECSSLAEEIICLRTDLDRLNLKYLQVQKELQSPRGIHSLSRSGIQFNTNSSPKNSKLDRSKKLSTDNKSKTMGNIKKVTIIAPKQKHEGHWDITDEIETPSPVAFGIMPVC